MATLGRRRAPRPRGRAKKAASRADEELRVAAAAPDGGGGSFSALSKPNFASKYAFESSRRDLHNALLCTVL